MPKPFSDEKIRGLDNSQESVDKISEYLEETQKDSKITHNEQAVYVLNRLKFYAEVESNKDLHINDFLTTEALEEEYNSLEVLRNPKATAEEKKQAFVGLEEAQPYIEKALDILGITKLATTEEIAATTILVSLGIDTMIAIGDTKNSYRKGVIDEAHEPPQLSQEFIKRYDLTAAKVKAYQDSIRVFRGSITEETIKALGKETFEYKSINPLALIVVLATAMRYGATNMDGVHLVPVTQIVFGHETYTGYRRLADAISDLKVTPADIADRMEKTAENGNKFGHLDLFSLKMLESIPEDDEEILEQIKAETPKRIKQIEAIGHASIEKARLEGMLAAAKSDDESAQNTAIALKLRETLENVKLHAKIIGYTALEGQLQNSLEDIEEGSEEETSELRDLAAEIQEQLESGEPIEGIEVEEEEDENDIDNDNGDDEPEAGLEIERTDGEEVQEEEDDQDDDVDNDEEQDARKEAGEGPEIDSDQEDEEQEEDDDDEDDDDDDDEEEDDEDEKDKQDENRPGVEGDTREDGEQGSHQESNENSTGEGDAGGDNDSGADEQEEDDEATVEGHSADGDEDDYAPMTMPMGAPMSWKQVKVDDDDAAVEAPSDGIDDNSTSRGKTDNAAETKDDASDDDAAKIISPDGVQQMTISTETPMSWDQVKVDDDNHPAANKKDEDHSKLKPLPTIDEEDEEEDEDELAAGSSTTERVPEVEIDIEKESKDIDLAISKSGLTLPKGVKDQIKNLFIWSRTEGPTTSIAYCLHIISEANANEFINYQDRNGNTPLMLAAKNSHDDMVKLLLQNGASSSLTNKQGKTALALAQKSKTRLEAQRKTVEAALESQKAKEQAKKPTNESKTKFQKLMEEAKKREKQAKNSAETPKETKAETQKLGEELQRIDEALTANGVIEHNLTTAMAKVDTQGAEEGSNNHPSMVDGGPTKGTVARTKGTFETPQRESKPSAASQTEDTNKPNSSDPESTAQDATTIVDVRERAQAFEQNKVVPPHLDQGKLRESNGNNRKPDPKATAEKTDDHSTQSSRPRK